MNPKLRTIVCDALRLDPWLSAGLSDEEFGLICQTMLNSWKPGGPRYVPAHAVGLAQDFVRMRRQTWMRLH